MILPPSCLAGAATCEIEAVVKEAQYTQPNPGNRLPKCPFVPDAAKSQVLQWGHSLELTCHCGYERTLHFVQQRFWRPSVVSYTQEFARPAIAHLLDSCISCQSPAVPGLILLWILSLDHLPPW